MAYAVLVDGAGGFTGKHLVRECLQNRDKVVATDLAPRALQEMMHFGGEYFRKDEKEKKLILIPSDLTNKSSLEDLFAESRRRGFEIKEAYRNAAIFDMSIGQEALEAVNVRGARNFCEVAAKEGLEKVIYVSTASIYGHRHRGLIKEMVGFEDTGIYPESKYQGEEIHAEFNGDGDLASLIVRPGLKYGPGSVYGIIILLATIYHLGLIPTVGWGKNLGKARSTYLYIENDAAAMRHLMKNGPFGQNTDNPNELAYNIADRLPKQGMKQDELMKLAYTFRYGDSIIASLFREFQMSIPKPKKVVGLAAELNAWATEKIGFPALLEPASVEYYFSHHCFDTEKLAKTGFRWPIEDTPTALWKTLEWYEQNNWPGLENISWKGLLRCII